MTATTLPQEGANFKDLGIDPKILSVLDRAGFTTPTLIQHQAIPIALTGKDMVGIAQTGTGKTIAFGVPMLQRLMQTGGRGLVIVPTRELAIQVDEVLRQIGAPLGAKTAVLIGGESMYNQIRSLRARPHVLITTPGRLLDHIKHGNVRLDDIKILVLDEADRMFDMGFSTQINDILKRVPKERQTMLFSATMPDNIMNLATRHMTLPLRIEVAPSGTAAEHVDQEIIVVKKEAKFSLLVKLLGEHPGSILIFSRTKYSVRKIAFLLRDTGFPATEIHSNRSLSQRREALEGFKKGRFRILVATDIAARGIDVQNITLVVNFDLPENSEDYVHRIGRTGRAGKAGMAISFATPDQRQDVKGIERLIRKDLPVKSHEGAQIYQSQFPQGQRKTRHFPRRRRF